MNGYLSKPIRPQELDEVLDSYLAIKDAGQTRGESASAVESALDLSQLLNVSQLLDRIDGDRVLLAELVDLFRADFPGNLRVAQHAIHRQEFNALRIAGHTLKGTLANLSATKASALAGDLEAMGKSFDLTKAQATLDRLAYEIANLMRALEALCPARTQ